MDAERAARERADMVVRQLVSRGIRDERVLAAMGAMPRELFLPPDLENDAYADGALPIASGQSISQPYIVALMTELLMPHPGMRVLEIGTGSGYQAALLASVGCDVLTIERHPDLAESARTRLSDPRLAESHPGLARKIRVEVGDGSLGWPAEAPFEGILVTAAAPRIPEALTRQLADEGRLVIPVGPLREQELVRVIRHGDEFQAGKFGGCVFVPLVGAEGYGEQAASTTRRRWLPRLWM
jgi:protein-L-isoaspartate(D-aspartate) O-methyltransferase